MTELMPEYMRIRTYLFNLIHKSRGELKIPGENELCRLFNVSRVTARSAIKGLVDDNYLIPRRGLGTYINADMIQKKLSFDTIGVISGNGKDALSPYRPYLLEAILKTGMNYQPVYLPDSGKPESLLELTRPLGGIIWMTVDFSKIMKYLELFRKSDIPLLLITEIDPPTGFDHILSPRYDRGLVIADYFFSKGHTKVLFVHNDPSTDQDQHFFPDSTYSAFCGRMAELSGDEWKTEDSNIVSALNLRKKLEKMKGKMPFSSVYSGNYLVPYVTRELAKAGLSIPGDLSYLVFDTSDPIFFNGLKPDAIDKEGTVKEAVMEWLARRIVQKDMSGAYFIRNIKDRVLNGETVKNRKGDLQ
ncbi:MAG: hypothetical protein A2020_00765 [Lentisphaerae bacterium GWF2_45_14]|nr:MAG: hypothetical protein A2020_00765 [Lentisphaerae bacterium GWF2_45_14]